MTTVLLQVSQGRRPCLEIIPERRPGECDQIICMMKQCWNQEPRRRPQFSGADTERLGETLGAAMGLGWKSSLVKHQTKYTIYNWTN